MRIVLWLTVVATYSSAQTASIHEEIVRTYNFQPHLLNQQQITQKSAALDQFWSNAKAQPAVYVPELRKELADFSNPAFFLYDGSALLLSLSPYPADRKTALAAMARTDLRDLQLQDYFSQVHKMATLDEDTTAAAFRILQQPDFKVFIPQHVLTLGQDYCLVYLLLPTNPDYWVDAAVARLQTEQDATAQKSLLLLLWYAQADKADTAISSYVTDPNKSPASRSYAQTVAQLRNKIGAAERLQAASTTEAALRTRRKERMKAVSDEALIDLDRDTLLIAAKRR